jgi:hypothetical protein
MNMLYSINKMTALLFLMSVFVSTAAAGKIEEIQSSYSNMSDSLRIPVYEVYPIARNYIFNQTVLNSLRWITVGTAVGATTGLIINPEPSNVFNFFSAPVKGGLIGFGSGLGTGIALGIYDGIKLQRRKKDNPSAHAYRCRFGYEFSCLEVGLLTTNTAILRINEGPGFSLAYRTLQNKPFIPTKISLGIHLEDWRRGSDYNVKSLGSLKVKRIESIVQYDFFTTMRLILPNWGIGIGYAWGEEHETIQEIYFNEPLHQTDIRSIESYTYKIKSPVLRGYIGCHFNFFDFTYADLKIGYEMIGPYLSAHNKKHFPYGENILFGLSLGTYIF